MRAVPHLGRVIAVAIVAAAILMLTLLIGAARSNVPLAFAPAPLDGPSLRQAVTARLAAQTGTAPLGLASALVAREPVRRGNL
ncbi:MAG: hypothetical protein IPL18_12010 [Sphingomonadales bacterium]|nr:hypothetical protein [Sphingomonadales bacterium]